MGPEDMVSKAGLIGRIAPVGLGTGIKVTNRKHLACFKCRLRSRVQDVLNGRRLHKDVP
jgi:hypothetical protein